jgi:hypothetical protein
MTPVPAPTVRERIVERAAAGPAAEPAAEPKRPAPAVVPAPAPQPTRAAWPELASEAAPTVQVTIGRIEVRAILPAPPAPAAPPVRRPATSLEDYLRARNGENR